ncbi:MAG TPA: hypothetical protein VF635_03975 [Propionibacteriaceae bacterium]
MNGFLAWLWTPLGVIAVAIVLDAISDEVRAVLDRIPLFLVKMAVRLLPPELRETAGREFRGDLHEALHGTDGLRLVRLFRGLAFALSLWLRISETRREAGHAPDLSSRLQRIAAAAAAIALTMLFLLVLGRGGYALYLAGDLSYADAAMLASIAAMVIGWAISVVKPGCAGSQSMCCLGLGGTFAATILSLEANAMRLDVWMMLVASIALMASGFVRDFGSRRVRPFGLLGQAALPLFAAGSWCRNVWHAESLALLAVAGLAVAVHSGIVNHLLGRMQEELFEVRYPSPRRQRVR